MSHKKPSITEMYRTDIRTHYLGYKLTTIRHELMSDEELKKSITGFCQSANQIESSYLIHALLERNYGSYFSRFLNTINIIPFFSLIEIFPVENILLNKESKTEKGFVHLWPEKSAQKRKQGEETSEWLAMRYTTEKKFLRGGRMTFQLFSDLEMTEKTQEAMSAYRREVYKIPAGELLKTRLNTELNKETEMNIGSTQGKKLEELLQRQGVIDDLDKLPLAHLQTTSFHALMSHIRDAIRYNLLSKRTRRFLQKHTYL